MLKRLLRRLRVRKLASKGFAAQTLDASRPTHPDRLKFKPSLSRTA